MCKWPGEGAGYGAPSFGHLAVRRADGAAVTQRLRLKDGDAFQRVYREGRSWATPLLVMRASPNGLPHGRIGFSTSKRIGGAVMRNRVKRRLRAAARAALPQLPPGWDVVLVARAPIRQATFAQIGEALRRVLSQSPWAAPEMSA